MRAKYGIVMDVDVSIVFSRESAMLGSRDPDGRRLLQAEDLTIDEQQSYQLRAGLASVAPFFLPPSELVLLSVQQTASDTLEARFAIPLQSVEDADYWLTLDPEFLKNGFSGAGIGYILYVMLSNARVEGAEISDGDFPWTTVPLACVMIGGAVLVCLVLDFVRSLSCLLGGRKNPQHLEICMPLLAMANVASSIMFTLEISEFIVLLSLSAGGLGAMLAFNFAAMFFYVDMFSSNAIIPDSTSGSQGQSLVWTIKPGVGKIPPIWLQAVAAVAAYCHIGALKIMSCDVGDWSTLPMSWRRLSSLAWAGLVSVLLGDIPQIAAIMLAQQEEVNIYRWSTTAVFSLLTSVSMLLVASISALRSLFSSLGQRSKGYAMPPGNTRPTLVIPGDTEAASCEPATPSSSVVSPSAVDRLLPDSPERMIPGSPLS